MNMVEKSAAYIGLISHRYGHVLDDPSINLNSYSITQLEFEKAKSLKLPILIFIMGEDHPVKRSEVEVDPEKTKKLETFKKAAKQLSLLIPMIR